MLVQGVAGRRYRVDIDRRKVGDGGVAIRSNTVTHRSYSRHILGTATANDQAGSHLEHPRDSYRSSQDIAMPQTTSHPPAHTHPHYPIPRTPNCDSYGKPINYEAMVQGRILFKAIPRTWLSLPSFATNFQNRNRFRSLRVKA